MGQRIEANIGAFLWPTSIATGIVLTVLQATGTIDIGWFWATFPFWIVPAVALALGVLAILLALLLGLVGDPES